MNRRRALAWLAGSGAAAAGGLAWRLWPEEGIVNDCPPGGTPPALLDHPAVRAAWRDLDPAQVWDVHVHVVGAGDGGTGIHVDPRMRSPWHPTHYLRYRFYLNAACAEDAAAVDAAAKASLFRRLAEFPPGARFLLLAFDYFHDEAGRPRPRRSPFAVPNDYVARLAAASGGRCGWIASVHPYRADALAALERVAAGGALGVKWLPQVMGIDPASPRCDQFYEALVRLGLPLLSHAGHEYAVADVAAQELGNPLRLRRALEHGVTVIVAHCAAGGAGTDLDRPRSGRRIDNFDLFLRLLEAPQWEGRVFGDLSAITQVNRLGRPMRTLLARSELHARLLNGSDYPLPGVLPLFPARLIAASGFLDETLVPVLARLHRYNPLLYDFVLKRHLRWQGQRFSPRVFETRRVFRRAVRAGENREQRKK